MENDVALMHQIIDEEEPELVTGSPPCEAFSQLLHLSKSKRDPAVVQNRLNVGRSRLRTAIGVYRKQYEAGRLFLHEHPHGASSWQDEEMVDLANLPEVYTAKGPMCHWALKSTDLGKQVLKRLLGVGHVRKETGWLTNSKELADILNYFEPELHQLDPRSRLSPTYSFSWWLGESGAGVPSGFG